MYTLMLIVILNGAGVTSQLVGEYPLARCEELAKHYTHTIPSPGYKEVYQVAQCVPKT